MLFRQSCWSLAAKCSACAFAVVVCGEVRALEFKIAVGPKRHIVKQLTPNGSNQTLNERMGDRHVRDCIDFVDLEDYEIRFPRSDPLPTHQR